VTEGHPFKSVKDKTYDIGGEFHTSKVQYEGVKPLHFTYEYFSPPTEDRFGTFDGFVLAVDPFGVPTPPSFASSRHELEVAGATAISRCKPTNSVADASTFLGEALKDGIPRLPGVTLWENKLKALSNIGSEFLNESFGWLPLLNDIRSHANAVKHVDTVVQQFIRDSGKQVRRRFYFDEESSKDAIRYRTHVSPYMGGSVAFENLAHLGIGDVYRVRETTQKRWFSGAFTYHLPSGTDSLSALSRHALEADKVFGTNVTPETLWELAPWSWAVDWVTNAGDVISNFSDYVAYGLILRYGYVMETSITKDTYTFVPYSDSMPVVPIPDLVVHNTVKQRIQANPFGFGITWDGLSPFQLAIAGALGLVHVL